MLEPALAERPGRIDQAIEIGLPGEAERRILVRRYAGSLAVPEALATATARRTEGVSPAFIKELMRRAAQAMLERGAAQALEARDVDTALEDMLSDGGRVTPRILGAASAMGFTAQLR
jgi:ATP-dependent 26S proteasome regulatory subunit